MLCACQVVESSGAIITALIGMSTLGIGYTSNPQSLCIDCVCTANEKAKPD